MHSRDFVVQDTVQRHNQVVALLCELLSCFSSWTSHSTKQGVALMLKCAKWRNDGGLSFCGMEQQANQMRMTSADIWSFTDYQADDEHTVYIVDLPGSHSLEARNVALGEVTASLAAVKLGNCGMAARAA